MSDRLLTSQRFPSTFEAVESEEEELIYRLPQEEVLHVTSLLVLVVLVFDT